ncbi:MAG: hypothetical protein WDM87_09215 [Terracidiphilus sp.]
MWPLGALYWGWATRYTLRHGANQAILEMEQSLETSQASFEIEPRVFYEDFHNYVLYVEDVRSGTGAANWRQVFMADVSDPANPLITTARVSHGGHGQYAGAADAAGVTACAMKPWPISRDNPTSQHLRQLTCR